MLAIEQAAAAARDASRVVATLTTEQKNEVLLALAAAINRKRSDILAANTHDLAAATEAGLPQAKLQRLALTDVSIDQLRTSLEQVAALPDPVGQIVKQYDVPSGLKVARVRTPLGVICMIYEARPAVTIDAFALCFKAGNACILKGGKEAARANALLAEIACSVLRYFKIPEAAMTSISDLGREALAHLLTLDQYIDLVIPRGGTDLIRFVARTSRIPTIQHYQGVCHIFVDASADLDQAEDICATAKTSAPATCNAAECILIHEEIAATFVPRLFDRYTRDGVEVRGDAAVCTLAPAAKPAAPDDFGREFLDLIVAMRIVNDVDSAIEHIHRYGSNHTEAILTATESNATAFCQQVQASCVLLNASTRFNDGFQLGLGAEIGISTTKIHAYGPMGLEELTTQRFVVTGHGETR